MTVASPFSLSLLSLEEEDEVEYYDDGEDIVLREPQELKSEISRRPLIRLNRPANESDSEVVCR